MKEQTRETMRRVLRQAVVAGTTNLRSTDLLYGAGSRESAARTYTGFDIERITEWNEDIDAGHINWGLSASTGFQQKLVVEYRNEMRTEWRIVTSCARTMDFGTSEFKRFTAAVLSSIFARTAQSLKDLIGQLIHDEHQLRKVIPPLSGSELLGVGLPLYLEATSPGLDSRNEKSGLVAALRHLPGERAIVPVISDFIDFPADARRKLASLSRYHRVLCCVVEDPRERGFPNASGQITVSDMNTGRLYTTSMAEAHRQVSADYAKRMGDLQAYFAKERIPFAVFSTDDAPGVLNSKVMKLLSLRGA